MNCAPSAVHEATSAAQGRERPGPSLWEPPLKASGSGSRSGILRMNPREERTAPGHPRLPGPAPELQDCPAAIHRDRTVGTDTDPPSLRRSSPPADTWSKTSGCTVNPSCPVLRSSQSNLAGPAFLGWKLRALAAAARC